MKNSTYFLLIIGMAFTLAILTSCKVRPEPEPPKPKDLGYTFNQVTGECWAVGSIGHTRNGVVVYLVDKRCN
jgi:hypothetical protein